jgi:hypothetical protein
MRLYPTPQSDQSPKIHAIEIDQDFFAGVEKTHEPRFWTFTLHWLVQWPISGQIQKIQILAMLLLSHEISHT